MIRCKSVTSKYREENVAHVSDLVHDIQRLVKASHALSRAEDMEIHQVAAVSTVLMKLWDRESCCRGSAVAHAVRKECQRHTSCHPQASIVAVAVRFGRPSLLAQDCAENIARFHGSGAFALTQKILLQVAMSAEQAHQRLGIAEGVIHELQEKKTSICKTSSGSRSTPIISADDPPRIEYSSQSDRQMVTHSVGGAEEFDARTIREEESWSYLARDFVGVVHAVLKQAMKNAENRKLPIAVTNLKHDFDERDRSRIATFLDLKDRRRSYGSCPWSRTRIRFGTVAKTGCSV